MNLEFIVDMCIASVIGTPSPAPSFFLRCTTTAAATPASTNIRMIDEATPATSPVDMPEPPPPPPPPTVVVAATVVAFGRMVTLGPKMVVGVVVAVVVGVDVGEVVAVVVWVVVAVVHPQHVVIVGRTTRAGAFM